MEPPHGASIFDRAVMKTLFSARTIGIAVVKVRMRRQMDKLEYIKAIRVVAAHTKDKERLTIMNLW